MASRQLLRDLPGVTARIGERHRAHAPVTIGRAADHCHFVLSDLISHGIHVWDDDHELPDAPFSQVEYFACRRVLVNRAALQEEVGVLEAEHRRVFILVLDWKPKDISVERRGPLQVSDDQVDRTDLPLPTSHIASPSPVADPPLPYF